jgi:tetratricopeptide (TPR) repeat protein
LPATAVGLTLFTRVLFILQMRGNPFSTVSSQMVDPYYYHQWALSIVHGSFWGSDVFFLRPLYPYLLAAVYALFGPHVLAVQLLQAALSGASCLLLYDCTRWMLNRRAAVFAAFGFALTGILVFYTGTLLYVEITVFLSLLFLWLILVAGSRIWLWIPAGVSFGLLVICRPEMLAVLPFLLVWLWQGRAEPTLTPTLSRQGRGRSRARALAALTVAALAVIAAVPVRNYIVARDPVLFTAHSGINFYYGNNPSADGTWQPTGVLERGIGFSHERLKQVARTVGAKEVPWSQASSYWLGRGTAFITGQPLRYLRLLGRKLLLFLSNYEVPNDYYPETARTASTVLRLCFVSFSLVLALGVIGMVWAWPQRRRVLPAYLFIGAYVLSSLLFYVLSRLRAPVMPFLLMFAGFGLAELVDALRKRNLRRFVLGGAAAVIVYAGTSLMPVRRDTYSAQAWTQTGNVYLAQRQVDKALHSFRRALAAQPTNASARYSLIMALAGSGRTAEAQAEFDTLARSAGSSDENLELLRLAGARMAIARRDFVTAAQLYRAVIDEDSTYPEAPYLLGLVYVSTDSLEQARCWLRRALTLNPEHEAAASALKAVEARLGQ